MSAFSLFSYIHQQHLCPTLLLHCCKQNSQPLPIHQTKCGFFQTQKLSWHLFTHHTISKNLNINELRVCTWQKYAVFPQTRPFTHVVRITTGNLIHSTHKLGQAWPHNPRPTNFGFLGLRFFRLTSFSFFWMGRRTLASVWLLHCFCKIPQLSQLKKIMTEEEAKAIRASNEEIRKTRDERCKLIAN